MTARPVLRSFGTPYYWTRVSQTEWSFNDGWGTYRLIRHDGLGYSEGWFLTTPEDDTGDPICDGIGEYVGDLISEAIQSEDTLKALAEGHRRRKQ